MHYLLGRKGWVVYAVVSLALGLLVVGSSKSEEVTSLGEIRQRITNLCAHANEKSNSYSINCALDYEREVIVINVSSARSTDRIREAMAGVGESFCLLAELDPDIHSGSVVWNGGQWTCEEFKVLVKP